MTRNVECSSQEEERYYRHLNLPSGDLRVSITADCNMRCSYCHNEGQGAFAKTMMSEADFRKVVSLGQKFGANKVRLTGGEPMLHPLLTSFIRLAKQEFGVGDVGINTNGTMLSARKAAELLEAGIDVVVVGIDFPTGPVSKDSIQGRRAAAVLTNIETASALGLRVQVASVYSKTTPAAVAKMFEWCGERGILLKVLEVSDDQVTNSVGSEFVELIEFMRDTFSLRMGRTVSLNERYGVSPAGQRVLFFHSHCRVRECAECAQMHMRVTTAGAAKPCILRTDTEYPLLGSEGEAAMRRAVHNLGNPPERPPV